MKNRIIILAAVALLAFSACKKRPEQDKNVIDKPEIEIKDGKLSPEALWSFGRIGEVSVSPDGKRVLYTLTYYSISENKGNTEIYSMNIDGSDVQRLTTTASSEWNAIWNPKGDKIGFIYADENGVNIYEMNPDGSDRTQISDFKEGDLEGFSYSPDGKKIVYVRAVPKKDKYAKLKEGLDKTTGRINDDLAYRHWDNWVDAIPQPFVADFDGKKVSEGVNILAETEFESPMRPWGRHGTNCLESRQQIHCLHLSKESR